MFPFYDVIMKGDGCANPPVFLYLVLPGKMALFDATGTVTEPRDEVLPSGAIQLNPDTAKQVNYLHVI